MKDRKQYRKTYWQINKKRINEELRTKPSYRYKALKARCKKLGVKFKIKYSTYVKKLESGCHYCGASILKEVGGGMDRRNNNNRNYCSQNLVPCCFRCNKIKSNMLNEKEMIVAMKAVKRYRRNNVYFI